MIRSLLGKNDWLIDWLIDWLCGVSRRFQQCTYPCFPGVLLASTPHNILSKPLAAFTNNNCRHNGQRWERSGSCRNDYHQSSEIILAEPGIEPATSCSQVRNATDWAMGLGWQRMIRMNCGKCVSSKNISHSVKPCHDWDCSYYLMDEP